jgi:peptidyl-prolyl cis-trans isomerase SurA
MISIISRNLSILFLIFIFSFSNLNSKISSTIVVKVGNSLVTSSDLENEVLTYLIINQREITQENANDYKKFALKNMINKLIKQNEIKKYKITDYNMDDLRNYQKSIAKKFNTDINGLKKIFAQNNIDYSSFVQKYKTELLWNTLIYAIYKNQINVNIFDVENEIISETITKQEEYNLSEIIILRSKYDKNKLNEILNLAKNKSFELAAKKFSVSDTAKKGGLIGWIKRESLSKENLEKIKNLNVNEISEPIFTRNNVLLLKVNNVKMNKKIEKTNLLKEKILNKKKEDKLNMFSRSHFSNVENLTLIKFQ